MLCAYLDEFGHIGPYIHRTDARYKESPVFGLAGLVLPHTEVRSFATWFYQRKCELLAWEIARAARPAYEWEKKGGALYTYVNIEKYRELRTFTNRFLNNIRARNGFVFYVGINKRRDPALHDPRRLYMAVLREAIHRLNEECQRHNCGFLMFLDEHVERQNILTEAARSMFNAANPRRASRLIEPPFQIESHRYQTAQAADWLCGLIGRLTEYECAPEEWPEMACVEKYFGERIRQVQHRSSIRTHREHDE